MKHPDLRLLRESRGQSQAAVAKAMRVSQSAVSKLEHRDDVSVAALRDYLAALGGTLEMQARFPEAVVPLQARPARVAERRPAWGDTLPPDWVDEIERVRRLTPEDRLREAASLSALLAAARPKND
jgi:transcriptional regulator with XRE-family HTH domain